MEIFSAGEGAAKRETVFPRVSNQEINRGLKLIAEICEVTKHFTFHLAKYTFATTVTLLYGVPIETISKLLGHTKLSTTMIYTHVMQSKVGLDMGLLQSRLDNNKTLRVTPAMAAWLTKRFMSIEDIANLVVIEAPKTRGSYKKIADDK